jgi:hypothetical protein
LWSSTLCQKLLGFLHNPPPSMHRCHHLPIITTDSAAIHSLHFAMKANSDTISQAQQDCSPYCSHECLGGLPHTNCSNCPNYAAHDGRLTAKGSLARLLMDQLNTTSSTNNGLTSLGKTGRSGTLYKVNLYQSGHVLVAKGYQDGDSEWLQNEAAMYARLQNLQGQCLPVCCGVVHLQEPLDEPGGRKIEHLLLLSWAGEALSCRAIDEKAAQALEEQVRPQLMLALRRIHEMQVVHGDTERRNFLYDWSIQRFMLVDFERSRLYSDRPPCDPGSLCRKTYRDRKGSRKLCMYCREKWTAGEALSYESPAASLDAGMTSDHLLAAQHQTYDEPSPDRCQGSISKTQKRGKTTPTRGGGSHSATTHQMNLRSHRLASS